MKPSTLIAVGAAVAALAAAGSAAAQDAAASASVQATFRGTAAPGCRLGVPQAGAAQNATVSNATSTSIGVGLDRLVGDDGVVIGSTAGLALPVVCNQAHTISLTSRHGGLAGDGPVTGGPFRSTVPYVVHVNWGPQARSFASQDGAASFPVGDAAQGTLGVTIEIPAGGAPLAAGAYSDELVLELSAAG